MAREHHRQKMEQLHGQLESAMWQSQEAMQKVNWLEPAMDIHKTLTMSFARSVENRNEDSIMACLADIHELFPVDVKGEDGFQPLSTAEIVMSILAEESAVPSSSRDVSLSQRPRPMKHLPRSFHRTVKSQAGPSTMSSKSKSKSKAISSVLFSDSEPAPAMRKGKGKVISSSSSEKEDSDSEKATMSDVIDSFDPHMCFYTFHHSPHFSPNHVQGHTASAPLKRITEEALEHAGACEHLLDLLLTCELELDG
ncbi:uncharacterized protein LAESUDRAFT_714273 [Laetiporus sulphureus 93-53]|uniref:Uncharacterized protein n=1 Tax=Laetiporus sulphureus 93-53 TaxID=1314785 RepID=A0A165E9P8_9APHY|nr:uncharacterized protein LAESUDRAFT_714273 [Laetiporus sulphureus 93-53]KZT06543.1 hypothetical protein LAESUDRAFT_714273 [Laetiporus sulphureus 93-53]